MSPCIERLAAAGFQIVPADISSHFLVERGGFIAFIERRGDVFGNMGAPGLMTEQGFGALVWRGEEGFFVGRGFEQPATRDQVRELRAFTAELEQALSPQP